MSLVVLEAVAASTATGIGYRVVKLELQLLQAASSCCCCKAGALWHSLRSDVGAVGSLASTRTADGAGGLGSRGPGGEPC